MATFAAHCGEKLRKQDSCTGCVEVFLQTNEHRTQDEQFSRYLKIELINPTNSTNLIICYAVQALNMLYRPRINYYKPGVMVTKIVPKDQVQLGIWNQIGNRTSILVPAAVPSLSYNRKFGVEK